MRQTYVIPCPMCPGDARLIVYDFGQCRETGYHDSGERLECDTCGVLDMDEVQRNLEVANAK